MSSLDRELVVTISTMEGTEGVCTEPTEMYCECIHVSRSEIMVETF